MTDFSALEEIADQKDWYDKLWLTALRFAEFEHKWLHSPVKRMDPDEFESELHAMWAVSYKLTKIFNRPEFKCPLRVTLKLKRKVEELRQSARLIQILTNPGLKPRHFKSMAAILDGVDLTPTDTLTLADVQNEHRYVKRQYISSSYYYYYYSMYQIDMWHVF